MLAQYDNDRLTSNAAIWITIDWQVIAQNMITIDWQVMMLYDDDRLTSDSAKW